jgi:hypothetical protein
MCGAPHALGTVPGMSEFGAAIWLANLRIEATAVAAFIGKLELDLQLQ